MVEMTKEKNLEQGLLQTLERANNLHEPVLFSYSFRFEVRDLLPILTHPADKNTIRVYWEQPSQGVSFAILYKVDNIFAAIVSSTSRKNTYSPLAFFNPRFRAAAGPEFDGKEYN